VVARYFFKAIRHLFFKSHLSGVQNLKQDEPVILVANHAGSYGPVSVITTLPIRLNPWEAHEVTDRAMVAKRIQAEFLEQELHLRPPLSAYLAKVIGRVCVALMKDIEAVPVYAKSRKILGTIQSSLALLEQGKNILVFAEDSTRRINSVLGEFRTGFAHVARLYYQETMKAVQFLPVAVNRKVGGIRIGAPIRFDAGNSFSRVKKRLKKELQQRIWDLYCSMESDGGPRKPLLEADQ
jgi:1-acyl-sn-glycerol-3-phosphate acyltransferase